MFTNRIPLFSLFGIKVGLDYSWFLLAILLVWSLTAGYFPWALPGQDSVAYLSMGIIGAVGLFGSIIFHEYCHALVARRFDLPISRITLFIFGGVAEMDEEPKTAAAEFWMAIAGPIGSFVLAGVLSVPLGIGLLVHDTPLGAVIGYLAAINLILALFNMIPAFPLDGGRILRAVVWWATHDFQKATRVAAFTGSVFAVLLIGYGVLNAISGAVIQGVWLMLIGFFVYAAASASRTHAELRGSLHGIPISRIMRRDVIAAPADLTLERLVDEYFYRHLFKVFPVVDSTGRPLGVVSLEDAAKVNREDWRTTRVSDIMRTLDADTSVAGDTAAYKVLQIMQRRQNSRLVVVDGAKLVGIVTMRDIMGFLAVHEELGTRHKAVHAGRGDRG